MFNMLNTFVCLICLISHNFVVFKKMKKEGNALANGLIFIDAAVITEIYCQYSVQLQLIGPIVSDRI